MGINALRYIHGGAIMSRYSELLDSLVSLEGSLDTYFNALESVVKALQHTAWPIADCHISDMREEYKQLSSTINMIIAIHKGDI
jgi:hypothetical protein